jgi:2-keto-4-pentenoate hydratase/2-oxohepta-3-ene-1,7-dioic acid hydratase in catechol pathway
MHFTLSTLRYQGQPTPVISVGERHWSLAVVAPNLLGSSGRGLIEVFTHWSDNEPLLATLAERLDKGDIEPLNFTGSADDFLAPIQHPSKAMFTGANYWDHVIEDMKMTDFVKADFDPIFFLKPSASLVGSGRSVRYPSQSYQLDWEVELVVVIGKGGRKISVDDAYSHVAGFTVGLDLSARDWQLSSRHPKGFDLFTGKAFDDSSPYGPKIVPASFVDPDNLDLKLWVNGDLKQNSNTGKMIWSIAEQISELSKHLTLEPGDLLFTGSPAGIGMTQGQYLKRGDHVEAEITGLGRIQVEILAE